MRAASTWVLAGIWLGSSLYTACANTHRDFGTPDAGGNGGAAGRVGSGGSGGRPAGGAKGGAGEAGEAGAGGNAGTEAGASNAGDTGTGGSSAGDTGSGGTSTGGTSTGGTSTGGTSAGGTSAGGTSAGGTSAGGTSAGGKSAGGTSAGGSGGSGGAAVTCSSPQIACSNVCVTTASDGKNCGSCGHDCLGGVCDLGTCQAVTIATGQGTLTGLSADGTNVFWSGASGVARRRADLSDTVHVLAATDVSAHGLAFSSTSLYWVAGGHVRVCALPNCTGGATDFISTVGQASCGTSMLLAGGKLYWSCYATYNQDNGIMYSLGVPLTTTTPTVMAGTNPSNPLTIVSDSTNVYWLNSSTYTADNTNYDGAVMRARLSDGTTASLVTSLKGDLYALAVSGSSLYFSGNIDFGTAGFTGAVLKVPLPNGIGAAMPARFANGSSVQGIVADSNYVYFSQSGAGVVSRCAAAGCTTPEVIAPGQGNPTAMAQDAVSIYWINYSGSVMRLAK